MTQRLLILLALVIVVGCSNSTSPPPPPPPTATIVNHLVNGVEVFINNVDAGAIAALSSASFEVVSGRSTSISYTVIKSTTVQGMPVGDDMAGVFSTWIPPTTGNSNFDVTNVIGGQEFFCPQFDNTTAYGMLIAINYGLVAENRTHAVIPANSRGVRLGYFLSYSNSNVAYWLDGSAYTGNYRYWNNLIAPDAGTGLLRFVIDQVP